MKAELEAQLIEAFPDLFRGTKDSPQVSCMSWGCECGDGWYTVIYMACRLISRHMAQLKEAGKTVDNLDEPQDFYWSQIKEKFGTLRLYYFGPCDDYMRGVIDAAEKMSGHMCEVCGAPARTTGKGWLSTLCDTHKTG